MSPKDKVYSIRLTDSEREQLAEAAQKAGFKDNAEYVRYMTIGDGKAILDELIEIKEIIKKLKK